MKVKFNFIKLIFSVFCFFAISVALYQLYNFLYKAPSTEFAVQVDYEEKINVTGYFVRDEIVVGTDGSKYFDIIVSNGGKISSGGVIANVYSTDNAARAQVQIRELESKIEELKSIISASSDYKDDISYNTEIRNSVLKVSDYTSKSKPLDAFNSASDFMTDIIKSKIVSGEIIDYSSKLKELQKQVESLKSSSSSVVNYIRSSESGYFSYKVDGLESKLTTSLVDDINSNVYSQILNICEQQQTVSEDIGRVVKGSDWRVCFEAPASKFEKVKKGSTLYVRLPFVTESKIKCEVVSINFENDKAYVALESNMVSGDLLSQRIASIDIIVDSYSGLKIDKNAIRKIDGQDGVFIKSNGIVKYKKINILHIASEYAIIEYDNISGKSVKAFDEVIVKGSDLYDGKVI